MTTRNVTKIRGHHLASFYESCRDNGRIGNWGESLLSGDVVITDTLDAICSPCSGRKPECNSRDYSLLDQRIAKSFGLRMNYTYSGPAIRNLIEEKIVKYKGTSFWER